MELTHNNVEEGLPVGIRFLDFSQIILLISLARVENEKFVDLLLKLGFIVHHKDCSRVTIEMLEGLYDL